MAHVEIKNINKAFETGKSILSAVSFTINDGEFVSLLGASGCGKTTILRIIAGLETADSGSVLIDGQDVGAASPKDRDIAMVFQNYALYPHLNVRENISMGLTLRKIARPEISRRVQETAALLGIEEYLDRRPSALSGGQRQRVALARALVRRPKVFLLDEPLSNLDALLRDKTRSELKLLFERVKGTVIYVTHDQVEAMTMSSRIIVLNKGRIEQIGAPQEIYSKPRTAFVASFLGTPSMNLFDVSKAIQCGLLSQTAFGSKSALMAGIRPEEILVSQRRQDGFVEVEILVAEPTGALTILTLKTGVDLRAVVKGSFNNARQKIWISLPDQHLHFFPN
ncbi:MAG: ABC transporter ATP-binding protein [Elusimicrobia bacterium]|nr:ABC transporter ATP-binding protein [Elusimicrobiota bacterium]